MNDAENIDILECDHKSYVLQEYSTLNMIFKDAYLLFIECVNESQIQLKNGNEKLFNRIFLMQTNKANGDIRTIYHALLNGYYATAESLFREVNDSIEKIAFASQFPHEMEYLLKGKLKSKEVRKRLKKENIPTVISNKGWGKISQMKHAEFSQIANYGQKVNNYSILKFHPTVDDNYIDGVFIMLIGFLSSICAHYYEYVNSIIDEKPGIIDFEKRIKKLSQFILKASIQE
ncbi:MAG: hypothetical protein ABIE07_10465 [Candidatus Zixiibacteriota bacterium]